KLNVLMPDEKSYIAISALNEGGSEEGLKHFKSAMGVVDLYTKLIHDSEVAIDKAILMYSVDKVFEDVDKKLQEDLAKFSEQFEDGVIPTDKLVAFKRARVEKGVKAQIKHINNELLFKLQTGNLGKSAHDIDEVLKQEDHRIGNEFKTLQQALANRLEDYYQMFEHVKTTKFDQLKEHCRVLHEELMRRYRNEIGVEEKGPQSTESSAPKGPQPSKAGSSKKGGIELPSFSKMNEDLAAILVDPKIVVYGGQGVINAYDHLFKQLGNSPLSEDPKQLQIEINALKLALDQMQDAIGSLTIDTTADNVVKLLDDLQNNIRNLQKELSNRFVKHDITVLMPDEKSVIAVSAIKGNGGDGVTNYQKQMGEIDTYIGLLHNAETRIDESLVRYSIERVFSDLEAEFKLLREEFEKANPGKEMTADDIRKFNAARAEKGVKDKINEINQELLPLVQTGFFGGRSEELYKRVELFPIGDEFKALQEAAAKRVEDYSQMVNHIKTTKFEALKKHTKVLHDELIRRFKGEIETEDVGPQPSKAGSEGPQRTQAAPDGLDGLGNDVVQPWLDKVVKDVRRIESILSKEPQQNFKKEEADKHKGAAFPTSKSNSALEDYLFGVVCSSINSSTDFTDLTQTIEFYNIALKTIGEDDSITGDIGDLWSENGTVPFSESDLPPHDFLTKRLLMLYISSSNDGWDISAGEYTKIHAGHVYFKTEVFYKFDYTDPDNPLGTYLKRNDYSPIIDDLESDMNVKQALISSYGANTRLVDLPLRKKIDIKIVVSEAVGSGSTINSPLNGANGFITLVLEQEKKGAEWVMVNGMDASAKLVMQARGGRISHLIETEWMGHLTINDLVAD
ncbi:MAG: hypothetical protein MK212_17995, partial [Saprospiraceae bacterium]|nr:hypothetical protein [Saprospiraceae bacterium]